MAVACIVLNEHMFSSHGRRNAVTRSVRPRSLIEDYFSSSIMAILQPFIFQFIL